MNMGVIYKKVVKNLYYNTKLGSQVINKNICLLISVSKNLKNPKYLIK